MVKIRGMVFVLGVLMLSGCSAAGVSAEPVEVAASVKQTPVPTAEPSATAAPIEMAAAPDFDPATPWGEAGFESANAWYLASMDSVWVGARPSDADLLGAGMLACDQIAAGTARDAVAVITGQDPNGNNVKVVDYAVITLCS